MTSQHKFKWIEMARELALSAYLDAFAKNLGTDQKSISKAVEEKCKGVLLSDKRKVLAAEYILRYALTPWDIPRLALAELGKAQK